MDTLFHINIWLQEIALRGEGVIRDKKQQQQQQNRHRGARIKD